MDIFQEVKGLHFPQGHYIIVGSGIMIALGLKEIAHDIDIVVTPELFQSCIQQGWEQWIRPDGKPGLRKDHIELYLDVNCGSYQPTFQELVAEGKIINDILFISPETLIKFKKEYKREKDFQDIALIETHLKNN
jgi:hypothetical protein